MTTINVTILTTSYPLTSKSTSGIFVARLVDHLPKNISTTVIAPSMGHIGPYEKKHRKNVTVFRYGPSSWEVLAHGPGGIPVALKKNKLFYLLVPFFLGSMLVKCIRSTRDSDIIHANWAIAGLIAGIAGWLLGKPVITTLRGEDVTRARNNYMDKLILKWCIKLSTSTVAVSESIRIWVIEKFSGIDQKVTVIANGVEQSFLEIKQNQTRKDDVIRLLTIGSLIERKGVDQIIKAMAHINDEINTSLTIVGKGPEKDNLETLAKNLGLQNKVQFVGEVVPDNVPKYLSNADIFILASHSEGRPNVILEAMASGLPVIATNIEGSNELVIHKETGLLFGDRNIAELGSYIVKLSINESYRKEISNNARSYLKNNNMLWAQTALSYLSLYQSVLGIE